MSKQKSFITEYRRYNLPIRFPVLLLSGDYWKISDIPSGRLHFHNCLEIGICHSESGTMEFYKEPLSFQAGDVTVVPRNVPHTTYSSPGTESRWSYLLFNPNELFRDLLPAGGTHYDLSLYASENFKHILSREEYPDVHQLLTLAIRELLGQQPNYHVSAKGLLLALYIKLCRIENTAAIYPPPTKNGDEPAKDAQLPQNQLAIAPALDYIEDNYMHPFTIDYLADLCHWSPTHFRRMFHRTMGTSPLDYIINTRIMKSCSLLDRTGESILNISEMVGFRSVSNYNRYFMKIMNMSPREYRKMHRSIGHGEDGAVLEYEGWMFPE